MVTDIQVPQVDAQIVGRDVGFLVRVDGDRVYMVGMGVGVDFTRDGRNDVVLVGHARKAEMLHGGWLWEVGLGYGSDLLLVHLPQFDRLV